MKTRTLRLAVLAGSVLLWFAMPSLGQTNLKARFSKPGLGMGPSETWTVNAIAAATLIRNSSGSTNNSTLLAVGHFQNSNDDNWNSHNDLRNSHDDHWNSDRRGKWVSAPEGGAAMNYLLLAGIACSAAIYLKRRKHLAGRDLA
jgi:hypothetical protein